jgi:putative tributyrin esterase
LEFEIYYSAMAWTTVRWHSEGLGKRTTAEVLLPVAGRPPFPTFYLLHGLGDDATMWMRHTRIEVYAREYPFVIVMPDGYRGFYTRNEQGPDYARHLGEELPAFIERHFQVKTGRRSRAIGGLSMGGYGALRVGLAYPDLYASINSHSGALGWGRGGQRAGIRQVAHDRGWSDAFAAEMSRVFGDNPYETEHDVLLLARRARQARKLPSLLIDCGTEDYLLDDNRAFHAALEQEDIAHEYHEHPGAHTWDYWDAHVRDALAFHGRHLGAG